MRLRPISTSRHCASRFSSVQIPIEERAAAAKRPPIAPELIKLPAFNVDIQFDVDTPIIPCLRPSNHRRMADAMVHSSLLSHSFPIVGHIDATGRRENNALPSQRRADAVRDILINTSRSAKRFRNRSARRGAIA